MLHFSFLTVCLPDSVLAFHRHGMQGRSFKANEVRCIHKLYLDETCHYIDQVAETALNTLKGE